MKHVTAAIVQKENQILICQRSSHQNLAGFWEFPGGKQEENESLEACVKRELQEELGIEVEEEKCIGECSDESITLHFYTCTLAENEPVAKEHQRLCWISKKQLRDYTFCPLDQQFLDQTDCKKLFASPKRIFAALPLPCEVTDSLLQDQKTWKDAGVKGRFAPAKNLHITLAFIGETYNWKKAAEILENWQFEPCELFISQAGHFGSLYFAKADVPSSLCLQVEALKKSLKQAGLSVDPKPFRPHITMVRKADIPAGYAPQIRPVSWKCREAILYQSVFEPGGVNYVPLITHIV